MTDEPDNLPDGGTDNVETSTDDTSESLDWYDPDDEQDTVDDQEPEETGDEEGETEEQPEEDSEEEPEAADATPEAPVEAKVRLADGTETTVGELLKGYERQADYTRKTQDMANRRKALEADASRIEQITQTFVDHLSGLLPDEPDPSLIYSDPTRYSQQKAIYDRSLAQVQKLIEMGNAPKEVTQKLTSEDHQNTLREENQRLVSMFPETGTQQGREKFFGEVSTVANELGFSNEELSAISDHRLFALAHWAKKGMAADKAKASAKAKVTQAPQAASPRKPGQTAKPKGQNKEAMRKLNRTGSIRDALAIDWE